MKKSERLKPKKKRKYRAKPEGPIYIVSTQTYEWLKNKYKGADQK